MSLTDSQTERARARLGSVLRGKWRLERVLGIGGMAAVFAAVHRNGSQVAIKVLHAEIAMDREVTERFLREGYAANSVDHPGTVKVLDDDVTEDGAPFLVMDLLEGETIESRWQRKEQRLAVSEVLAIADQLLDVLAVAHDKGIVHRDLKPDNLFLTRAGELKILDFGIARLRELPPESHTRTKVGALLGTPAYMAPEQARGRWELIDARTDIWSVGATLFTLLSGKFVHEATTIQEQLIQTATSRPRSIGALLPSLPPAVVELIDCALSFDAAARWPDARTMQRALRASLRIEEERDAPLTLPTPSVPRNDLQTPPPAARTVTTWASGPQGRATLLMLAGMALSVGGGIAVAWHLLPKSTPTTIASPEGPSVAATVLAAAPPIEGTSDAISPVAQPPAPAKAEASANASPVAVSPVVDKRAGTARNGTKAPPTVKSSAPPIEKAAPEPQPKGGGNPFDKRF